MPGRRSAGEGSIYKRKEGRWCAAFVVGWAGGRAQKRYLYGPTRQAVAQRLAQAQREHAAGRPAPERQTLAQFAARYQQAVVAGLAPNTRSNVGVALARHILPALGHVRLARLGPADIQTWLTQTPGAPASRRLYHRVLHRLLAQAVEWGELAQNPAARVRAPRQEQPAPRVLELEHARRILAAVRGDPWEALAWLALTVGPRRGELLALQWGDVDWTRAQLTIQRNYTRGEVRVPKSPASRRTVPLFPAVLDALRHRRAQWPSAPWVFTGPTGGLVGYEALRRWWARAQRACGLVPLPVHATRHAAASYLLALGMPLPEVARVLGHSSVAVTGRTYSHALVGGGRAYVEALGRLLAGEAVPLAVNAGVEGEETAPIRQP